MTEHDGEERKDDGGNSDDSALDKALPDVEFERDVGVRDDSDGMAPSVPVNKSMRC